jgi:hypothetical protein
VEHQKAAQGEDMDTSWFCYSFLVISV